MTNLKNTKTHIRDLDNHTVRKLTRYNSAGHCLKMAWSSLSAVQGRNNNTISGEPFEIKLAQGEPLEILQSNWEISQLLFKVLYLLPFSFLDTQSLTTLCVFLMKVWCCLPLEGHNGWVKMYEVLVESGFYSPWALWLFCKTFGELY